MYVVSIGEYTRKFDNKKDAIDFITKVKRFMMMQGGTMPIIHITISDLKGDQL